MTDTIVKLERLEPLLPGSAEADEQLTEYSHKPSLPSDGAMTVKKEHIETADEVESYSDIEMLAERHTPKKPEPLPPRKSLRRAAKTKRNRDAYLSAGLSITQLRNKAQAEANGGIYRKSKKPMRKHREDTPEPSSSDSDHPSRPSTPSPRIRIRCGHKSSKSPGTVHSFDSPPVPISPPSSTLSPIYEPNHHMGLPVILICMRTISQLEGRICVNETFLPAPVTLRSFLEAFSKQLPPGHLSEALNEITLKIDCHGPDFSYTTSMLILTTLMTTVTAEAEKVFGQKIRDVSQIAMMKGDADDLSRARYLRMSTAGPRLEGSGNGIRGS